MIRTLIVEDDPRLAGAHAEFATRVPGFAVIGTVHSGREALQFIERTEVGLVLLDFYLPDMTGLDVCRALRAQGPTVDVIAVTSARDVAVVRAAMALGVVQYLLKPFTFATFRDKLQRYAEYRRQLSGFGRPTAQQDLDRAFAALRGSAGGPLPKGLSNDSLATVVDCLRATDQGRSASEVAESVGMSRVTARRYLEMLVERELARRNPRYGGAGRPEYLYYWATTPTT